MEKIIIVGHGSRKKDANDLEDVTVSLHKMIHPNCESNCVLPAYLQFCRPNLEDAIEMALQDKPDTIIIHPFFLGAGMHVTKDIPEIIEKAQNTHPHVKFIYTRPLGGHEWILRIVEERIKEAKGCVGEDIESLSMRIIEQEADLRRFAPQEVPIVKRVIHATGDLDFATHMVFHHDAIKKGIEAIVLGKSIVTDVKMVAAGINRKNLKRFGVKIICALDTIADKDLEQTGTRSAIAMETALKLHDNIGIVAIGNAPTALIKAMEILDHFQGPLPLVIGVPVGFVNAVEAKILLSQKPYPFITNISRKGGSSVAVATVNAIARLAMEESIKDKTQSKP